MIGVEEDLLLAESGHRSIMLSKAFGGSGRVGKVAVINCPVSFPRRFKDLISGKTKMRGDCRLIYKGACISVYNAGGKINVINLTTLFPESDSMFSRVNRMLLIKRIRSALNYLGFDDYALWISNPRIVDIASKIPAAVTVFDAIDNLRIHSETKRFYKKIENAYGWIERNVDLICIASEGQREMFPASSKLYLLSNGVDSIFFSAVSPVIPADLKDIIRPIAGYAGALQDRIDIDLMEYVIKTLPEYNFVFVGPVIDINHIKPLLNYSNVHIMGNKKFGNMPSYIDNFDVCIIPHKVNALTISMDPLKTYEYLARGKPVVSTPVAGTDKFKNILYIADDKKKFAGYVKLSIREDSRQKHEDRINVVSGHAWSNKINAILDRMFELKERYNL
jgi:glycosyltransferase involved in cell wall biosynthesis